MLRNNNSPFESAQCVPVLRLKQASFFHPYPFNQSKKCEKGAQVVYILGTTVLCSREKQKSGPIIMLC